MLALEDGDQVDLLGVGLGVRFQEELRRHSRAQQGDDDETEELENEFEHGLVLYVAAFLAETGGAPDKPV
jgi:hypothetical protein